MHYFASTEEMKKLDDLAVESGLEIRQMMELAGWHMVYVFNKLKIKKDAKVLVVAGKGNKGGDGLCAARHLANNNWKVTIVIMERNFSADSSHQLKLIQEMKLPIIYFSENRKEVSKIIEQSDLIVDSLIGYNLKGPPRAEYNEAIKLINKSGSLVIAFDIPTGIDASSGEVFAPSIKANYTLTLALPKKAFENKDAKNKSGKLFLADIGIPAFLYDKVKEGIRPNFGSGVIEINV